MAKKKTTSSSSSSSNSKDKSTGSNKVTINKTSVSIASVLDSSLEDYAAQKTVAGDQIQKVGMNLFGLPFQFPDQVDPRINSISKNVGRNYTDNILLEGPVCTIIPGKPKYLPSDGSKSQKVTTTTALVQATSGNMTPLKTLLSNNNDMENFRLYDFENAYEDEYMNYVNILCRTGAAFLGISDTTFVGSAEYSYERYDWRNYKWNEDHMVPTYDRGKTLIDNYWDSKSGKKSTKDTELDYSGKNGMPSTINDVLNGAHYVQFYIDPEGSSGDSVSNTTTASSFKGMLDSGTQTVKEFSFLANAGGLSGADDLAAFVGDSAEALTTGLADIINNKGVTGQAANFLSRVTNLAGDVIKGNNIIIPDIYESSQYSQDGLALTVHLKSPYGNKLSYYLHVFVPMMHLLALALPKQASANSYGSPFLIKAFVEGMFSVNLGMVSGLQISKVPDSRSVDGLPMEVDVTLQLVDLYSDLMMSPSDAPLMFVNNSSLVEYLSTNCGLSLAKPNIDKKYKMLLNALLNSVTDIPNTVSSAVRQKMDEIVAQWARLGG